MTAAETFKACAPADREVALMALKIRATSLGIEAEAHRDLGGDALADIVTGQQAAVLAALDVLRELHKEGGK
jgi:hypothetical protein